MKKNPFFDLTFQYKLYLDRMGLKEELMPPEQKKQLKEAFFGACGQMLLLMRDDLSQLSESNAIATMKDMLNQVQQFFQTITGQAN
jgi:hypothetical protein